MSTCKGKRIWEASVQKRVMSGRERYRSHVAQLRMHPRTQYLRAHANVIGTRPWRPLSVALSLGHPVSKCAKDFLKIDGACNAMHLHACAVSAFQGATHYRSGRSSSYLIDERPIRTVGTLGSNLIQLTSSTFFRL